MSVNVCLRCPFRLQRKLLMSSLLQRRALSSAEAVNALRPFYFAVHPDFFGQYPREREVNENSLKRLNGYLENVQNPGSKSFHPVKLTFYVRDTTESNDMQQDIHSGFRSVSLTLRTNDVLSTVVDVLASCSLPVEHMKRLKENSESSKSLPNGGIPFYRPIKWDKSYYTFTGFRDPEQELQQAKFAQPTINFWLRNNEPEAKKKHRASLARREELSRLKNELCQKMDLTDIRWQRKWGVAHRCCQLQSLTRLSLQNPEVMINLQGHTVVFADQSGMDASGNVNLGNMDVHDQWTKLLQQVPNFSGLQHQTDWLKARISDLLGGTKVVQMQRLGMDLSITEHYNMLNKFYKSLISQRLYLHPRSLNGLTMLLENNCSTPRLHEMGHFIIPTSCDIPCLQVFLQRYASEARLRILQAKKLQEEEEEAVQSCLQSLSLRGLSKEPSVTSRQMILCCKRLVEQPFPSMQGLHICISHFYSVLHDGDVYIPWDWKR